MKNKSILVIIGLVLVSLVLGCGLIGRSTKSGNTASQANRSGKDTDVDKDKGIDTVVPEETTGVPECDEVMDMLTAEANNPDDGYIAKAIKATFLNKIKENVKKSIEENKTDKVEMAKSCKDFKAQLEKYKAEEDSNKGK